MHGYGQRQRQRQRAVNEKTRYSPSKLSCSSFQPATSSLRSGYDTTLVAVPVPTIISNRHRTA